MYRESEVAFEEDEESGGPSGRVSQFEGAVVAVGALGVVESLELRIVPSFQVEQCKYRNIQLPTGPNLQTIFEDLMLSAYSVSLFTIWAPGPSVTLSSVWAKHNINGTHAPITKGCESKLLGSDLLQDDIHMGEWGDPSVCTQGGRGAWNVKLSHFLPNALAADGNEVQSEYFVSLSSVGSAMSAMQVAMSTMLPELRGTLRTCEIRIVEADRHWLSPCFRRECVAFHFTWHLPRLLQEGALLPDQTLPLILNALEIIETTLAPFDMLPHWGKVFVTPPDSLRRSYAKNLPAFNLLMRHSDPYGKFRNDFITSYLADNVPLRELRDETEL
mmetsp:Transcript_7463/g.10111  ORF Transcript_7463/g.10111 Transcript_7463/m.10111 type:complete len:330 (-) Transcript_7463:98-1087(-)